MNGAAVAPGWTARRDTEVQAHLQRCCHLCKGSTECPCDRSPSVAYPEVDDPGALHPNGPLAPDIQARIVQIAGAELTRAHRVRLLTEGVRSFIAMPDLVRGARRSLRLENFIFRRIRWDWPSRRGCDAGRTKGWMSGCSSTGWARSTASAVPSVPTSWARRSGPGRTIRRAPISSSSWQAGSTGRRWWRTEDGRWSAAPAWRTSGRGTASTVACGGTRPSWSTATPSLACPARAAALGAAWL